MVGSSSNLRNDERSKNKKSDQIYSNVKTSSKRSNNNDVINLCLMAKNYRDEINNTELYLLPTYEQMQDAFAELHEESKNNTIL